MEGSLQIKVTVRHAALDDDLKERARHKAEHLLKYYDKIQSLRVVLDKGGDGFTCEVVADLERMHDLVARTTGREPHAVINQAMARLERQLLEHKGRTRHRKGRGPSPHQPSRS